MDVLYVHDPATAGRLRDEFGSPPDDPDEDQTGRIEQFIGYFQMYVSTADGVQRWKGDYTVVSTRPRSKTSTSHERFCLEGVCGSM